jgi:LmbE family N-acetylglucosaminyl deacetylase
VPVERLRGVSAHADSSAIRPGGCTTAVGSAATEVSIEGGRVVGADEWVRFEGDVGRVLAVVAHPDDLEYGAAAAVARWTRDGHEVSYLLASRGEAGIDGVPPEECAALRTEEQVRSAAVVGVDSVEWLDHPDGVIVHGPQLRRDIAEVIRDHRPDTVITINHRESWGMPGSRNSADHRAMGEAVLDAVADAANRWIFPDVGGGRHRTRRALVASSPLARHVIDVSDTVDLAVASLAEHRTYLEGLGDHPMADPEFLRWLLADVGAHVGFDAGLAVEVYEF